MSGAIPPAPTAIPVPLAAATSAVLTAVGGDTAQLAQLPTGTVLTAQLGAVDGKAVVLTLADGSSLDLKLPPALQLPAEADLTLQVVNQGGLPALKLLSVNGRPLLPGGLGGPQLGGLPPMNPPDPLAMLGGGQGLSRGGAVMMGGNAVAQAAAPGQPAVPAGPLGLTATVLRAGPVMSAAGVPAAIPQGGPLLAQAVPPVGFANLTPGTQFTVRIAGFVPPPGSTPPEPQPAGTSAFAAGAAVPNPASGAAIPTNPASPRPGLSDPGLAPPPSSSTDGGTRPAGPPPLVRPAPSAGTGPTPAPPDGLFDTPTSGPSAVPAQPATLAGTVMSHTPGGTVLVQTPAGLLSLPSAPAMPVGSDVLLDVVSEPLPPPPLLSESNQPRQGLTADGWPNLANAADALLQTDRQAAEQLLRMIPQPGPRLAAAMSMFAGAVRSGEFKQLLGDNGVKGLERAGKRDLADRLKKDFLALSDEAERPRGNGEWRVIPMPFAHGAQVDPVYLYVHRKPKDEEEGGKRGQEQRFLLEVRMSRLGRIQFDGLVSRESKRFDLIVRTEAPLSPGMCRDIAGIFADCGQLTGITGAVGFQSGRGFVELPPADAGGTRIMV